MHVVQQPISVQRTSFNYQLGGLKRETSGNLTLSFFPTVVPHIFKVKTSFEADRCQHGFYRGHQRCVL